MSVAERSFTQSAVASQKNYDGIWSHNPDGFGPPSPEIMAFSHSSRQLDAESTIVDVGSGNGRYALAFAATGYKHVTALEISKPGCDIISARGREFNNLSVVQADILGRQNLGTYDIVVSSGLVEEFQDDADKKRAVERLQDMTNADGRLVLRYCLFISNREPENRMSAHFVRPLFPASSWNIVHYETDPEIIRNKKSTINDGQNRIRRQTLVANKLRM